MKKVTLRKFPYPFKIALTICSDIDGSHTVEKFLAIQNFSNTERDTDMGPGIGLEIGNSFFPLTANDTFSYLSNRSTDRAIIRDLIRAGYIDCMHSYGNGARSRKDVQKALDTLAQDGCQLDVWVDHSRAPTNLGKDNTFGTGDVIDSPTYHTDLTLAYGIKFIWTGRSTSLVGQESPITVRALSRIYDPAHPRASLKNLAKELAKIILARAGNQRFAIHRNNKLLRITCLADSRWVYEFNRCNNHWKWGARPDSATLTYVLCRQALENLKAAQGYMIIYTHLGMGDYAPPIPAPTRSALRRLAQEYQAGEIYVSTTSRLLNYCLAQHYLKWSYHLTKNRVEVIIHHVADLLFGPWQPTLEELQGITFYVPDRRQASILLGDKPIARLKRNSKDHTGRESVMIPRTLLIYSLD